jgi:hypothetical protein
MQTKVRVNEEQQEEEVKRRVSVSQDAEPSPCKENPKLKLCAAGTCV